MVISTIQALGLLVHLGGWWWAGRFADLGAELLSWLPGSICGYRCGGKHGLVPGDGVGDHDFLDTVTELGAPSPFWGKVSHFGKAGVLTA